jgi:hypothetical protein
MLSKVFVIFPTSMNDTVISDGFAVDANIKTHIGHDVIHFHRYTDTVFVTESIWASRVVQNSTLPFLHANNINTENVFFTECV